MVWRPYSGIVGGLIVRKLCVGFSERKLCALGPMATMSTGYRDPIGGAVVATFIALGLRVKTLDHPGLDIGDVIRRYPLGGVVVEPRRAHLSVFGGKCGAPCFSFSIFDKLCNMFPSSHCIGSAGVLYL